MTTTITEKKFKLVRHEWLTRKHATIWRIKIIEKKNI
jgi:hypothetical protein